MNFIQTVVAKEELAVNIPVGKIYALRSGARKIQRSSVVERSAVNRLVVGSNPTAGAKRTIRSRIVLIRQPRVPPRNML
jgi:hypothetical protein